MKRDLRKLHCRNPDVTALEHNNSKKHPRVLLAEPAHRDEGADPHCRRSAREVPYLPVLRVVREEVPQRPRAGVAGRHSDVMQASHTPKRRHNLPTETACSLTPGYVFPRVVYLRDLVWRKPLRSFRWVSFETMQ